jgi:sugar phosphate isomerase/epimerase
MRARFPFRLGATSYVYEADLAGNARRLAGQVDDVELVLFDTPALSNLPDPAVIRSLASVSEETGLTYTVHLPVEVGPEPDTALAVRVVQAARPLAPWAYVVHLRRPDGLDRPAWLERMRRALEHLAGAAGGYERLCLENLEGWPPELFLPLLEQVPASLCIDVGHFWRQERDPAPYLVEHMARARVVHLHGCDEGGVDHLPLSVVPPRRLQSPLRELRAFRGVLTLEVFGLPHFEASRDALAGTWEAMGMSEISGLAQKTGTDAEAMERESA